MKKGLLRTTAIALAVAGASSAAHAGLLETMEQMMAASGTAEGAFTYETVVADTDTGFEIHGVRIEPEPGQGVVTVDVLRVDAFDVVGATAPGGSPAFMDVTMEGVTVPPEALDGDTLEVFPDGLTFDMGVDYQLDQATQTLRLDEFAFSVSGYGSIAVSADVTGLDPEAIGMAMMTGPDALATVTLNNASITLDDEGGLAQLFATIAAEEGMDRDTFVNSAMLPQLTMMGAMFGGDPVGAGVVESIIRFLGDYASPQGPLTITIDPPAPVALSSLMQLSDPTTLPSLLGLGASYQGGAGLDAPQPETPPAEERQGGLFGQDGQGQEQAAPATPGGDGAFATLMAMAAASGLPPEALTYDAVTDSPEGFVLSNVRFEPAPGDYIEIETLSVGRIDMASVTAGTPPTYLQLSAQGLVVPTTEDNDLQEIFGDQPVEANLYVDYALDPAAGTFAVNGVTLELVDMGTFNFTLGLGGMTAEMLNDLFLSNGELLNAALLESATLSYTDTGFMRRMLTMQAQLQGTTAQAMVDEQLAGLDQMRPMLAADPIASAALDALRGFIADYQAPRGPISIVVNPPTPVPLGSIEQVADPSQIPQILGVVIAY